MEENFQQFTRRNSNLERDNKMADFTESLKFIVERDDRWLLNIFRLLTFASL